MPKRARREPINVQCPTDPAVRASAGRIVDMLQQLVFARPDMIVPLEEIVSGILISRCVSLVTQMGERDERRSLGGTPLPEVFLSELPAMLALLELEPADAGPIRNHQPIGTNKRRR